MAVCSLDMQQKLDSLFALKKMLDKNIHDANTVLGLGAWLPDVITVARDPKTQKHVYPPDGEENLLPASVNIAGGRIELSFWNKVNYAFALLGRHFWGYLLTAIAISLGAPFWFDLLNKLMKLRTSQKEEPSTPASSSGGTVSALKREG